MGDDVERREAPPRPRPGLLALVGPGLLVAATGVGAGDLATAAFTGGVLGTAALWAVVVGAVLKLALTEGLARWQLATGETLLEGAVLRLGRPVAWVFLPYLLLWSFFVGSALMSACGATLAAILPGLDVGTGKVVYGALASVAGCGLVLAGGFKLFERVMSVCIAVMFVVVVVTAALLWPGTGEVLAGFVPSGESLSGEGLEWSVALLGGIGGTLTVLAYGYWIREEGRAGAADVPLCRIDLGVGYAMTAVFGVAMVIIGASVEVEGEGASLILDLGDRLAGPLGPVGKWAFLLGAFGAVFSSLLGVWQSVPYLFADFYGLVRLGEGEAPKPVDTGSWAYRGFLLALTVVPVAGLFFGFKQVQKLYAVIGACFLPLLALTLLLLNGRRAWVGDLRNGWASVAGLLATLAFFGWLFVQKAGGLL